MSQNRDPETLSRAISVCPNHVAPLVTRRRKWTITVICLVYLLIPIYNSILRFIQYFEAAADPKIREDEELFILFIAVVITVSTFGNCFFTTIGLYGLWRKRYDCVMAFLMFMILACVGATGGLLTAFLDQIEHDAFFYEILFEFLGSILIFVLIWKQTRMMKKCLRCS